MSRRLFVAGLLFVAACSKKDDAPAKPADQPTAEKPADKTEKPADKTAVAAKLKDAPNSGDLAKLPVGSDVVAGLDIAQLQSSALWTEFIAPAVLKDDVKAKLDEFKQKCDLDPFTAIKTVTIGLTTTSQDAVAIAHGLDKAKVAACAEKMKADPAGKIDVAVDGEVTILKPKGGGMPVAFTFAGDDAVIVVGSKADAAGVKAAAGAMGGLSSSAGFVDIYNKLPNGKALWMVGNGKLKQLEGFAKLGMKATHVFGTLDTSAGLDLDLRLRLASEDQATQSATMLKSQLGPSKDLLKLDKMECVADGSDLKINMVVSKANLGPMIESLKGVAKMMGGGMGMGGAQ